MRAQRARTYACASGPLGAANEAKERLSRRQELSSSSCNTTLHTSRVYYMRTQSVRRCALIPFCFGYRAHNQAKLPTHAWSHSRQLKRALCRLRREGGQRGRLFYCVPTLEEFSALLLQDVARAHVHMEPVIFFHA